MPLTLRMSAKLFFYRINSCISYARNISFSMNIDYNIFDSAFFLFSKLQLSLNSLCLLKLIFNFSPLLHNEALCDFSVCAGVSDFQLLAFSAVI